MIEESVHACVEKGQSTVILFVDSSQSHFGTRRFRFVAALLAGIIVAVLLSAVVSRTKGSPVEYLSQVLCCDGCCRINLLDTKITDSEPARSTILHLSDTKEIDYTGNGHRVSQHMESALNELDHIERHVKLGLPKYLQESAAQREADLVDHRFEQDLEGTSGSSRMHAPSTGDSSYLTTIASSKELLNSAVASKPLISRAVAEASDLETKLRHKDREEQGRIIDKSSRELSKDAQDAEKAVVVGALEKTVVGANKPKTRDSGQVGALASIQHHPTSALISQHPAKPDSKFSPARPSAINAPSITSTSWPAAFSSSHRISARSAMAAPKAVLVMPPKGSGVDAAEWARLQGIQRRIETLIGGYTHGASQHSSFLRHFDRDHASPAELSASAGPARGSESTVRLAEEEAERDRKAFLNL